MKVMVMSFMATKDVETAAPPTPEAMEMMGNYNDQLVKAGILLAAEGLKPQSAGVRMQLDGANSKIVDGPFAETKEQIIGFQLWQVRSMEEAVEWVRKFPGMGHNYIEIRPLFEMEDFANWDDTGDFAAGVQNRRDTVAAKD
jgi:hypothetical protein